MRAQGNTVGPDFVHLQVEHPYEHLLEEEGLVPEEERRCDGSQHSAGPRTASDDSWGSHRPGGPSDQDEATAAPAHALDQVFPPDVYDQPHHYGTGVGLLGGPKAFRETVQTLRRIRNQPDAPVTMYRSLPPEHAHTGFRTGDWVSVHPEYARGHGLHHDDEAKDWPVIKTTVPAHHLWNNGDSLDEFGYHGPPVGGEVHYEGGADSAAVLRQHRPKQAAAGSAMYHWAPQQAREDIAAHGLDHTRAPGFDPSAPGPHGVFLHHDQARARDWVPGIERTHDLYQVDTRGLGLRPDPYDTGDASYVPHAVPPERIKRVAGVQMVRPSEVWDHIRTDLRPHRLDALRESVDAHGFQPSWDHADGPIKVDLTGDAPRVGNGSHRLHVLRERGLDEPIPMHVTAMGQAGPDYDDLTFRQMTGFEYGTDPSLHHHQLLFAARPGAHGYLGHIQYEQHPHEIEIHNLSVWQAHQRRGVASQLMAELERRNPGVPIDHGNRSPNGTAWAKDYYGHEGEPRQDHANPGWTVAPRTLDGKQAALDPRRAGERTYWHVAHSDNRASIMAHGLDYERRNEDYYGGLPYPKGNYLFKRESPAHEYRDVRDAEENDNGGWDLGGHDIWRVKGAVQEHRDPFHDDESGLGRHSVYTTEAIPSERLELVHPSERRPLPKQAALDPRLPDGYAMRVREQDKTDRWGLPAVHVDVRHENRSVGSLSVHQRATETGLVGHPNIYVDPEHQRQGLATAMYAEVHRRWPDVPIVHSEHRSDDARLLDQALRERFGPGLHLGRLDPREAMGAAGPDYDDLRFTHSKNDDPEWQPDDLDEDDEHDRQWEYHHFKAFRGGEQVGRMTVEHHPAEPRSEIWGLEVAPEHQRRGVARQLLDHARTYSELGEIHHSGQLTDDGWGFATGVGGPGTPKQAALDLSQVRVLNPTTGHDPDLFDGEELKAEVRRDLIHRWTVFCARNRLANWHAYTEIYFTGGEASEWSGPGSNPNGDFDVQVGLDFDEFRATKRDWSLLTDAEVSAKLNKLFWTELNDHDYHPAGSPRTFDLTWYSNPAVNPDISAIRPYAAWNVLREEWAVHPSHYATAPTLPHGVRKALQGAERYARQVLALPEPQRTREAAALFTSWHEDRNAAFGPDGAGVFDYANLRMKALESTGTWQELQAAANRLAGKTAAQLPSGLRIEHTHRVHPAEPPYFPEPISEHRVSMFSDDPEAQEADGDFRPGEISYVEHQPQPDGSTHVQMRETRWQHQGRGLNWRLQDALHERHPHVHSVDDTPSVDAVEFRNRYLDKRPGARWTVPEDGDWGDRHRLAGKTAAEDGYRQPVTNNRNREIGHIVGYPSGAAHAFNEHGTKLGEFGDVRDASRAVREHYKAQPPSWGGIHPDTGQPFEVARPAGARYLRFGLIPTNERSRNHLLNHPENGVSVFDLHHGYPIDTGNGDTLHEFLGEWQRGKKRAFVVSGDQHGEGSDTEPVLRNVKVHGEWNPPGQHNEWGDWHKEDDDVAADPSGLGRIPDDHIKATDFVHKTAAVQPLSVEPDLYWRFHHPAVPLDAGHASSRHWGISSAEDLDRPGFSCFQHPHDLHRYLQDMDWTSEEGRGGVDFDERRIVGFHGQHAGRGIDGEDLAVPHPGSPAHDMSYEEFARRIPHTPTEGTRWDMSQAHYGHLAGRTAAEQYPYVRNNGGVRVHAPTGYGQEHEPWGRYMSAGEQAPEGWERGTVSFANPLHVEHADGAWKQHLAEQYGATGRELSGRLLAAGHDGVITHDQYGIGEMVDIRPKGQRGHRTAMMPSPGKGPLPIAPGKIWYRFHHEGRPWDTSGGASSAPATVGFGGATWDESDRHPGYSALGDPHALHHYLGEQSWYAMHEIGSMTPKERGPLGRNMSGKGRIVQFTGTHQPRGGYDGEDLVMPGHRADRVEMSVEEFQRRLKDTPYGNERGSFPEQLHRPTVALMAHLQMHHGDLGASVRPSNAEMMHNLVHEHAEKMGVDHTHDQPLTTHPLLDELGHTRHGYDLTTEIAKATGQTPRQKHWWMASYHEHAPGDRVESGHDTPSFTSPRDAEDFARENGSFFTGNTDDSKMHVYQVQPGGRIHPAGSYGGHLLEDAKVLHKCTTITPTDSDREANARSFQELPWDGHVEHHHEDLACLGGRQPHTAGRFDELPEEILGKVRQADPEEFHAHFAKAIRPDNPFAFHLTHHTPEGIHAAGMTPLLAHNGAVGALVHDHGDGRIETTGLFNQSGVKNAGSFMLHHTVQRHGTNYVECFGPHLPQVYEKLGFRTQQKFGFDRELAHPNWDYARFGEPDYHQMHLQAAKINPPREAAMTIDPGAPDMHWDDPVWVAAERERIEAKLLAENGPEWFEAHRPFLDANWQAALHQLGAL